MVELNISVVEEAYKALLTEKTEKESLSDVILRLTKRNQSVEEVVGTQILSRGDWAEVKKELKKTSNLTFRKLDK